MFQLIAHRGFSSRAPENTLAAFELALEHGFQNIETDTQLCKDGAVVVHDEQLGRVNDGVGCVATATLEYLATLDAGKWFSSEHAGERIPALEELLRRYHGRRVHLHLELKSAQQELPAAVAGLITANGWHQFGAEPGDKGPFAVPGLTVTSFHLHQLQAMRKLLPGARLGWLVHELDSSCIQTALQSGLQQVCPRANILTAEGVAAARAAGLVVRAWGIKSVELLHHAVACGAQGATVNWPDVAQKALEAARQEQQRE